MRQGSKERSIGISSVCDRVVQQALYLLLTPLFEPDFLECSYAYRKGKNALIAVDEAQRQLLAGKCWVVETDIANFFDNIKHDLLVDCLRKKITDERVINLIKHCLKLSNFYSMSIYEVVLGVSQGSALSPLFGNIYLNQVDLEMSRPDFSYLRYSDDILVLAETKQVAEDALNSFKASINKIGLDIKQEKTRILHAGEGFNFLGYHFDLFGKGPSVRALEALAERLRTLNQGCDNLSLPDRLAKVESVLRGWEEYFGAAETFEPEDLYSYYILLSTSVKRGKTDRLDELAAQRCRIAGGDEKIKLHIADFWLRNNHKVKAIEEAGRLLVENPECREAGEFLIKLFNLEAGEIDEILKIVQDVLQDGREEDYMSLAETCASKGLYDLAMELQAASLPRSSKD
ncbi:MAG: reverse transcriptase domain-containing protein, partial [Dehalobacter sp.]|nr:reverse transcriptase domain-containing protein [Dehalobacter sp.]